MRKALLLSLFGLLFATSAMACEWGEQSASSDQQQTVMTTTPTTSGSGG